MRKKILKIISSVLTLVIMASGLAVTVPQTSFAADGVVSSKTAHEDSYGREPVFTVSNSSGEHTAMCINYNATPPEAGTALGAPVLSTNDALRRVLYYGCGGPGDLGIYTWTFTAIAASSANGNLPSVGDHYTGIFDGLPVPPEEFKVYIVSPGVSGLQDLAYWILEEKPAPGYAYIQKSSAITAITNGNPCYSLEGAQYTVYSDSNCTKAVTTLTTDANGKTGTAELEAGTYYVRETKAPKGYYTDSAVYTCKVESGKTTSVAVTDIPGNDPVGIEIKKIDQETGDLTLQGAASLEGAQFTINYYAGYYDTVESLPSNPTRTWVLETKKSTGSSGNFMYLALLNDAFKVSGDAFYYDESGNTDPVLPLGTITITETKAPVGYLLDGAYVEVNGQKISGTYIVKITQESDLVHLTGGNKYSISDRVVRGDIELTKTDAETGRTMAGVRFRLTSVTTGESHEFVTDKNGYYSTSASYTAHTANTNGGNAGDGIYFGLGADGKTVAPNDSYGALPYDAYLLEELPCPANEGKVMVARTIEIKDNNTTVNLGNIENQNIVFKTNAVETGNNTHYAVADGDITIRDTITYDGLISGQKYTLKGILMDAKTGKPLVINGETVTAERTFTPGNTKGSTSNEFTFSTDGLAGKTVVIFEEVFIGDLRIAAHQDINDTAQSVYFADIGTAAKDGVTGTHTACASEDMKIIDTVEYVNLKPGKEYTITGILMDKETGEPALDDEGNKITAETVFTPEEANGTVDVTFTFSGLCLSGKSVVAFETVLSEGKEVAVHSDINDEDQTVDFPKIYTTVRDAETGIQNSYADEEITIIDTVTYENLTPGAEYVLKGSLIDQTTGEPVTDAEGNVITAETVFTPEERNGEAEVTFAFDGTGRGGSTYVVFEDLYVGEFKVATHADLNDNGQTIYIPKLKTTATSGGSHEVNTGESVKITDTVEYKNLVPGEEYTLKGTVMDKETGKALVIDGKTVTAENTFIAENADGTIEMNFTINASALGGKSLVVFEKLYTADGSIVASHEDIDDKDQTVTFTAPSAPPKTGDNHWWILWLAAAVVSAGIIITGITVNRRKARLLDSNAPDNPIIMTGITVNRKKSKV